MQKTVSGRAITSVIVVDFLGYGKPEIKVRGQTVKPEEGKALLDTSVKDYGEWGS